MLVPNLCDIFISIDFSIDLCGVWLILPEAWKTIDVSDIAQKNYLVWQAIVSNRDGIL